MLTTVELGKKPYIVTQGPHAFDSDTTTKRSPFPNGMYSASTKEQIAPSLINQFRYELSNTQSNIIDVNGLDPDSIRRFTRECAGMVEVIAGKVDVFELVKKDPKTVEAVINKLVHIVYEPFDLDIEARRAAQKKIAEAYIAEISKAKSVLGKPSTEQVQPLEPGVKQVDQAEPKQVQPQVDQAEPKQVQPANQPADPAQSSEDEE